MLGPVVAGECLRDRLGTGVAPGIAQACQHLGGTLAGEDGADEHRLQMVVRGPLYPFTSDGD